ncbi:hypothetical protein NU219Hw_g5326t1 [Hortaea werneckii]
MSDNELDAELLGMVGGESDDEGSDVDQTQQIEDRSPSQEPQASVEKNQEAPKRTKGVAQKVRRRRKKARREESEDEEMLDLGSGGSPSPAPMSDNELDAPGSPEEDTPLYSLEGKYHDAEDRENILRMPEIEREAILADRAQEVLKRQQDQQLKKALAAARSSAASKNKRSAKDADLDDDSGRRATRPKAEKARNALDDYKRAREMKGDRGRGVDSGRDRRASRSPSSAGSDRDAEGESEVEWAEPSDLHRRSTRDEPPAELKDFERCRVGRSNFAKVCFFPDFENAITGCFTRVSIGLNRETGQNQYRMAQIKRFVEGKPYQMEGANGKNFSIDTYALVAHGKAEKPWPFSACSDSRFTDQEYDRYVETLQKENVRVPKKGYLHNKLDDIHRLLNTQWDDNTLSLKFAKQKAMAIRCDPANAAKIKLEKIQKRKADAEEAGDEEEVARCEAELAALENSSANVSGSTNGSNGVKPSAAGTASAAKKAPGAGATMNQDRLAALNSKNRSQNAQEVRKALIEERRKLNAAREQAIADSKAKAEAEAAKKRLEEEAKAKMLAVPKDEMADLFGEGGSDASRAATPVGGKSPVRRSRAATPLNGVKKEKGSVGQIGGKKKNMDDEVIGNMDLEIDVEI